MRFVDRPVWYDRDGYPITQAEWRRLREVDPDYFRVAWDEGPDWELSTVWLGIDHNFGDGPPLIFESLILGKSEWGGSMWRYPTLGDARRGHKIVLAELRRWQP